MDRAEDADARAENDAAPVEVVAETPVEGAPSVAIVVLEAPAPAELAKRSPARALLDAFLRARNPNTLLAYQKDLASFAAFLQVGSAELAAERLISCAAGTANALVLEYRSTMIEKKLAPNTINRRLSTLRAFAKLGRMLGVIAWTIEIEGLDTPAYRDTRGPGDAAVAAMLSQASARSDAKGIRDVAVLRLLHDRVLRRGEVVSLDREHYDAARGLSLRGKGRTEREWISLPTEVQRALERWIRVRGDAPGPLFTALDHCNRGHRLTGSAVYAIIRRLGSDVGAVARPHGMRHVGITRALEVMQGDVRKVQKFSRHRDVRTLMIYDDARTDAGGEVAARVAMPELGDAPEEDGDVNTSSTRIACGRGHVYTLSAIGKWCCKEQCGAERGQKTPERRIEERVIA